MSRKLPANLLSEQLAWHPAVAAWRTVAQSAPNPIQPEVLRQGRKPATYRLVGSGPRGAPIIAPRSQMAKTLIERTPYEQILPHVSVTSPRYYGFREVSSGFAWLFLGTWAMSARSPSA
jgi:hypothetical protein